MYMQALADTLSSAFLCTADGLKQGPDFTSSCILQSSPASEMLTATQKPMGI